MTCGFCRRAGLDECYCSPEATDRFRLQTWMEALEAVSAFGCDLMPFDSDCGKCQACIAKEALRS
jgi:hypothetical protein